MGDNCLHFCIMEFVCFVSTAWSPCVIHGKPSMYQSPNKQLSSTPTSRYQNIPCEPSPCCSSIHSAKLHSSAYPDSECRGEPDGGGRAVKRRMSRRRLNNYLVSPTKHEARSHRSKRISDECKIRTRSEPHINHYDGSYHKRAKSGRNKPLDPYCDYTSSESGEFTSEMAECVVRRRFLHKQQERLKSRVANTKEKDSHLREKFEALRRKRQLLGCSSSSAPSLNTVGHEETQYFDRSPIKIDSPKPKVKRKFSLKVSHFPVGEEGNTTKSKQGNVSMFEFEFEDFDADVSIGGHTNARSPRKPVPGDSSFGTRLNMSLPLYNSERTIPQIKLTTVMKRGSKSTAC